LAEAQRNNRKVYDVLYQGGYTQFVTRAGWYHGAAPRRGRGAIAKLLADPGQGQAGLSQTRGRRRDHAAVLTEEVPDASLDELAHRDPAGLAERFQALVGRAANADAAPGLLLRHD
jgi:hypothetical protein